MTGWWILICGCASAAGALFLLSLVSHEIGRIELVMESFARTEERAAKRRKKRRNRLAARSPQEEASVGEGAPTDGEPVVAELATGRRRVAATEPPG